MGGQPLAHFGQLLCKYLPEPGIGQAGRRSAELLKHRALRGDDFGQLALHQDDAVFAVRRQAWQKQVHDFYDFAFGLGQPRGIGASSLNRFEFEVATGIVLVGGALVVRQRRYAARRQHLHHQARAGTRQAGHNGDEIFQSASGARKFSMGQSGFEIGPVDGLPAQAGEGALVVPGFLGINWLVEFREVSMQYRGRIA